MPSVRLSLCVLGLLFLASRGFCQESPYGDHPRLGGTLGQLRSRIQKAPSEEVETPDVITLKGGVKREAYFLKVYGERLVYYVKETSRSWLREEVLRSEVESIDFEQYLPLDPVLPRKIEAARKQPVRKDDLLSGVFTARQGRTIQWTAEFSSEIDKVLDYSEDATDYGSIDLRSTSMSTLDAELPEELLPQGGRNLGRYNTITTPREKYVSTHSVRARGKYYLFAPGAIHNDDWVLVLGGLVETEVDNSGRETSLFTTQIPDETFILYFSPAKRSFELAWSSVGGWTWSSLVGLNFERLGGEARPAGSTLPRPFQRPLYRPSSDGAARKALALGSSRAPAEPERADRSLPGSPWRTDGWKRPTYRLASK